MHDLPTIVVRNNTIEPKTVLCSRCGYTAFTYITVIDGLLPKRWCLECVRGDGNLGL